MERDKVINAALTGLAFALGAILIMVLVVFYG